MEIYIRLCRLEVKKSITLINKTLNNINLFKFKPESLFLYTCLDINMSKLILIYFLHVILPFI